ncbi:MAG: C10 family peptidase [Bacteroidaceae bacterium]|nr:C10 family peptidase [Bacteroidaceae bacterium]
MRKHLLTLLALAAMPLVAHADVLTRDEAAQRADAYLQDLNTNRRLTPVTETRRLAPRRQNAGADTSTEPAYYVFSRGAGQGYVIVSADDQTDPVLGYTDAGDFDYAALPDNMRSWLDDCEAQLMDLRRVSLTGADGRARAPRRAAAVPTHPAIPALMTSKWNQGSPYNNECPLYTDNKRCVTGCVATAMAQVMYYQRAKSVAATTKAIPSYNTGEMQVKGIAKGAPLDWDNMRDDGGSTAAQHLAVAQLMHYCGVSVEMGYTSSSSGAYSSMVGDALKNYFGYGSSVQYVGRYGYSNIEWDALLYNELAHDRPLYLSGANSQAGHAFVCDGYDGKRNFHINWGWGGQSDGYYLLSKLTPGSQGIGGSSDGYNDYQEAVIGIVPANYSKKAIPFSDTSLKRLCVAAWDTDGDGEVTYGEAAKVTDLGTAFRGTRIKTFNELVNCTKLATIPADAFAGCVSLTAITLPEAVRTIGSRAFAECRNLKTLRMPDTVAEIGDSAFAGCKALTAIGIAAASRIEPNTFEGCAALTAFTVPATVVAIGDRAFAGCTRIKTFDLETTNPAAVEFGQQLFDGVDLSAATLNVPAGTRAYYADDPQWSLFGNFYEVRQVPDDKCVPLATGRQFYIYNVGAQAYLTKGEAWGTQAVCGAEPMRFELRHDDDMPEGQYYLYSDDTGNNRHILFRTIADDKVGAGVKCCFVDGTLSDNANWVVEDLGDYTYRIAPAPGTTGYVKDRYLGIQPNHRTNALPATVKTTMGAYFDVPYTGHETFCQWRFVDVEATYGIYNAAQELQNLLAMASAKRINAEREQEVLDNLESTKPQLVAAQRTLRKKLGFIHFTDDTFRDVAITNWDVNGDAEISYQEAAMVDNLGYTIYGTRVVTLDELQHFTGLTTLYGNSFEGCADLKAITLPESVTTMYYRIFYGCSSLAEVAIPRNVGQIGDNSFEGCTALRRLTIAVDDPARIQLGTDVFKDLDLAAITLCVPQGSRELYAQADVWRDFGTIEEVRATVMPAFAPITADEPVYIYHLGTGRYIGRGEAYGTQAVVGTTGFIYRLKRTNNMPADTYYLQADNSGTNNKVLFRTSTDTKVGAGVKTCFVDGTLSSKAYWTFAPVEGRENVFTLQAPQGNADYVAGQYLGIYTSHATDALDDGEPTYGLYWDITDGGDLYAPDACHWALVRVADVEAEQARMAAASELLVLIGRAKAKALDTAAEQAVYDDLTSTREQLEAAAEALRQRLGYVAFADEGVKRLCVARFDLDEDEELTADELAAATTLGQTFRQATTIRSFDELHLFTSLTAIGNEAFRSCSQLASITLPPSVTAVGTNAFTGCSMLRFMRILNPTAAVEAADAAIPETTNIFVEAATLDAYAADEAWSAYTVSAYTGTPVVTARPATRYYGRSNPNFDYAVLGAPTEGVPTLTSEADQKSPVGTYAINVARGTVPEGVELRDGQLTVAPAPLTIKARSYTRNIGQENPAFELDYTGFRNRETAETALSQQPTVSCEATAASPAGEYAIVVAGAQADNYEITYVSGVLTVVNPDAILAPSGAETAAIVAVYAPDGKQRTALQPGLNIVRMADGSVRKIIVR